MAIQHELRESIKGDVDVTDDTLEEYSYDASLFGVRPKVVVFPKDVHDIKELVHFINKKREEIPGISLTGRAGGTDMTGGPLTESISVSFTKYMNHVWEVNPEEMFARVQPGVFYRDFEKVILPEDLSLPCYPASKSIAALGGMVANNCAGEKTLRYGKMNDFIQEIKAVFSDGNEYVLRKLNMEELEQKKSQDNFEGEVYRRMHSLLEDNYDIVKAAKPDVAKNSAGYNLWDVYDREQGTFDLTQLFGGSQGTLGIWAETRLRLVHEKPKRRLTVLFFNSWDEVPEVVNKLLPLDPESIETFDDATLKLGLRFMPQIAKKAGSSFLPFALKFWPEALIGLRMLGLPKLTMLIEFAEDTEEELDQKINDLKESLEEHNKIIMRELDTEEEAEKYWTMRRESFSLLRKEVSDKRTAPFVDDFCVKPEFLPEFLPKVFGILKKHGIKATLAGHAGEGNFHIIPLMDLSKKTERDKIPVVLDKVNNLTFEYGGTMTAEHNDGLIRSPYLEQMYGKKVYDLFVETKNIFDPNNIFNPGKKINADLDYAMEHIDH
ncbi:MAG: FAD-binding oxidoreductase [Candidatus Campbellbacteria bacterium]|nr:FAD-binding oxidoreductase [Candidatus Campbellbacteria bacterium]